MTKIEWTEKTWNPIVGCSVVSPGCTNCYAMKMAARLEKMLPPERRGENVLPNHYSALTRPSKAGPVWTGRINRAPDHILFEPLRRRTPTMYFVNSMSDLFHEDLPDEWILDVLDVIRRASYDGGSNCGKIAHGYGEHTFQVLTKRSARMRQFMNRLRWTGEKLVLSDDNRAPLVMKNLWLGVSAEDQKRADERIPDLLATPAAVRFVSAEPLLGPIAFKPCWLEAMTICADCPSAANDSEVDCPCADPRLDWVIVGGESGPGARPMHPAWARAIRDQCNAADVAFFFKQWGEWLPSNDDVNFEDGVAWARKHFPGRPFSHHASGHTIVSVGKARAGRMLDGREWNEMPKVLEAA